MRAGNGETELAFPGLMVWENARPPSRFSSETGLKADAKHRQARFRAFVRSNAANQDENRPKCRGCEV